VSDEGREAWGEGGGKKGEREPACQRESHEPLLGLFEYLLGLFGHLLGLCHR